MMRAGKKRDKAMTLKKHLLVIALLMGTTTVAQSQNASPPPPAANQQQSSPQQKPLPPIRTAPTIVTRTELVVVPVTVKDHDGRLVSDLEKDDFRAFADGVEQQIIRVDPNPFPLSAVVLIDDDLPQKSVDQVQKSLVAIAAGFGPNDEVALVTYEQFPETVADFSSNNDQLFTKLKRLEVGSHTTTVIADPTTAGPVINGQSLPNGQGVPVHGSARYENNAAIDDAVFAASQMLRGRGRDRRKIVFLISDGSNSKHNQHTFEETLHSLLVAGVSVYSISVTRSLPVGRALLQRGTADVDKYAADTGGEAFFAAKQRDLERLYSDVTEQARNEYTLTFSPQGINQNQDYHPIEIRVRRPGLSIKAREGYYQSAIALAK
jgi:VWFA-related protein